MSTDYVSGGPVLRAEDLHKMAWHMHYEEGMSWEQIADELEEPHAAVQRMAAAYERLTDTAAAEVQHTLF
ncbi:hypothetical protein [Williamsia sp. DF01-3]|uniref:hypothetical protein n=1 Tax=Williamsia sp. DF01-3 TaxID=2934157 RepID=UPI000DB69A32|nr:hypothetical protein [Williamsia sp. DF01-3]MCK0515782.1 hypothetical protein [Williamsia sp. DF01-3]PZU01993.1 MAG: hypothetical protein DI630_09950 [Gordonia sp. (in: high G+C Gram-positive bacteria)]